MLPFKKVRAYKFVQKMGKLRRVRYVIAENLRDVEKLLKEKGIRLAGKISFYKSILIVSDRKKERPKLVTKSWIEHGP